MTVQQCTITPLGDLSEEDQASLKKQLEGMDSHGYELSDFDWVMTLDPHNIELVEAVSKPSFRIGVIRFCEVNPEKGIVPRRHRQIPQPE